MTTNVRFTTVATSFAALSITGIPIRDLTGIPTNAMLQTPCLIPKPDGFINNIEPAIDTYGTGGSEKITLKYEFTYRYLHAPIGMSLDFGGYDDLIANIAAIMVVVLNNDTLSGSLDFRLNTVTSIGPVEDPAGNVYHGCDFVFSVMQLCEV